MTNRATDQLAFNPLDPRLVDDPHAVYREVREANGHVHVQKGLGLCVVMGLEEGREVFRQGGDLRFLEFQRVRQGNAVEGEPYCRGLRDFVLMKAGEDHKRVRGTFSRQFGPARVEAMRDQIAETAHSLIDRFADDGEVELMEAFAAPLVLSSITRLLDVPEEDVPQIVEWLEGFKVAIQGLPMNDQQLAMANSSIESLRSYFTGLLAQRRERPGDDLLSRLVAEADADNLTEDELVANAWGLYAAGGETTTGAVGNAVITLVEHPDQLQLLIEDPTLLPNAVEELMRFAGPGQAQFRMLRHEIELAGCPIPADTPIAIYFAASNRDPRCYEDPERFDITRDPPPRDHLGFGSGPHKCAGQHLARATLAAALTALFTRLDGVRIAGDIEWPTDSMLFRGPVRLPIAWERSKPPT